MRLNYYVFDEHMNANTRWKNGAELLDGECKKGFESCTQCDNTYETCENFVCIDSETELQGLSITTIKKLIKSIGGLGYVLHTERDGTVIDHTVIKINQNNSKFKYNRHL